MAKASLGHQPEKRRPAKARAPDLVDVPSLEERPPTPRERAVVERWRGYLPRKVRHLEAKGEGQAELAARRALAHRDSLVANVLEKDPSFPRLDAEEMFQEVLYPPEAEDRRYPPLHQTSDTPPSS